MKRFVASTIIAGAMLASLYGATGIAHANPSGTGGQHQGTSQEVPNDGVRSGSPKSKSEYDYSKIKPMRAKDLAGGGF